MANDSIGKVFEELLDSAGNGTFLDELVDTNSPTLSRCSSKMNISGFCNQSYEWITEESDHDNCKCIKEYILQTQDTKEDIKDNIMEGNHFHFCGLDDKKKCTGSTTIDTWISAVKKGQKRSQKKLKVNFFGHMWQPADLQICVDDVYDSDNIQIKFIEPQLRYERGTLVWVKMRGFPTWPAMIDDDPDNNTYFWITEENSKEVIQYHVTYFDEPPYASRSWRPESSLKPLNCRPCVNFKSMKLYKRFQIGFSEAKKAAAMSTEDRIAKYGFATKLMQPDVILMEH